MFCVPTIVIYNFTLYLTLAEFITRALTKRLVSSYLWFSSYIKWIDMHMCTLYVCYMLHCEYTMYCILDISFTFWKQWRNVSQGTGQPAPQRDPLQDTRDLPKLGLHIRWQWGTTSSSCMWLASHSYTSFFSALLLVTAPSSTRAVVCITQPQAFSPVLSQTCRSHASWVPGGSHGTPPQGHLCLLC